MYTLYNNMLFGALKHPRLGLDVTIAMVLKKQCPCHQHTQLKKVGSVVCFHFNDHERAISLAFVEA